MMINLSRSHIFSLLLLIFPSFVSAEQATRDELDLLFGSSLESLLTLSIASKKEETTSEAPGIVNIVSADDIQRYGYRNLRDILDRQPHIQVTGSNLFPHNRVTMRGVGFSHTDNTVLLLLNGRPLRDGNGASESMDIYEAFPVDAIKQIEIIRGPGSVLYGSNAFAGAINIVTKDAPDSFSGVLHLSSGSFGRKKGTITGGGKVGDIEFFGSLKTLNYNGEEFDNITDEAGNGGTYKTGAEGEQLVLNAQYKGFTLNSFLSNMTRDHARSSFVLPSTGLNFKRFFVDLGYKYEWNTNWTSTLNLLYHQFDQDFFLNASAVKQYSGADHYLVELSNQGQLTDNLSVLFGATYNIQDGYFRTNDLNYNDFSIGLYGQLEYQMTKWIKLIGGVQFNQPEGLDGEYSPRIAAIFDIGQGWGTKLLYGEAFREGTPVERYVDAPSVIGNPSIKPETMATFDAQLFFESQGDSFSITYFQSVQKDLITRVGAMPQQILNSGEIKYQGIELEGTYDFDNGLSFLGNVSYQTNGKDDGTDDATYAPDWMIKTGLSYDSPRGYQLSVFNSYFAASTLQNEDVTTVAFNNKDANSYNLLTANLRFNVGKVLKDSTFSEVDFSLYVDNLLDEDIYFPSVNRRTVNSIPHHTGRGVYGTISVNF